MCNGTIARVYGAHIGAANPMPSGDSYLAECRICFQVNGNVSTGDLIMRGAPYCRDQENGSVVKTLLP